MRLKPNKALPRANLQHPVRSSTQLETINYFHTWLVGLLLRLFLKFVKQALGQLSPCLLFHFCESVPGLVGPKVGVPQNLRKRTQRTSGETLLRSRTKLLRSYRRNFLEVAETNRKSPRAPAGRANTTKNKTS